MALLHILFFLAQIKSRGSGTYAQNESRGSGTYAHFVFFFKNLVGEVALMHKLQSRGSAGARWSSGLRRRPNSALDGGARERFPVFPPSSPFSAEDGR